MSRTGPTGWVWDTCGNGECEEGWHWYPPVGGLVVVDAAVEARIVGTDRYVTVLPGMIGVVRTLLNDAHQAEVDFNIDKDSARVWLDVEDDGLLDWASLS